MSRTGQKEIAERCGVSVTSVWAALSGNASRLRLSDETRRRIVAEAKRLGYRPHAAARRLRTGRSRCLVYAPLRFPAGLGYVATQVQRSLFEAAAERRYAF